MAIPESEKALLRTETMRVLLALRAAFLAQGANKLKHWDQLANRTRGAIRTSRNPQEWFTTMLRTLAIQMAPTGRTSDLLLTLTEHVQDLDCARDWLELVEREHGLIVAMARRQAEIERKVDV